MAISSIFFEITQCYILFSHGFVISKTRIGHTICGYDIAVLVYADGHTAFLNHSGGMGEVHDQRIRGHVIFRIRTCQRTLPEASHRRQDSSLRHFCRRVRIGYVPLECSVISPYLQFWFVSHAKSAPSAPAIVPFRWCSPETDRRHEGTVRMNERTKTSFRQQRGTW